MQKLGNVFIFDKRAIFPKTSPDQFIPEDGVCPDCGRLKRNHDGVERAIAANGLTKVIERDGVDVVVAVPDIPYCRCSQEASTKREQQAQMAHLPLNCKTFESFEPREGTQEAIDAALSFAIGKGAPLLLLTGGTGCGKSHLLQSIGWVCLNAGDSVCYELVADLLDKLRATYGDDAVQTYEQVAHQYRQAKYLLLDDIGMEKASEWVTEKITALVDERYRNGRRLAVATNKNRAQIAATMGFRLASRLWDTSPETVNVVRLTCSDYRTEEGKR
mgnify:CR=1 FL=1